MKYGKIGDFLEDSQYGISKGMNDEKIGYPIFRMNEIHNMLTDLSADRSVDITNNELSTFKLNDGDVLFNRTNSYKWVGRTGIYYKNTIDPEVFASYLVRFVPDKKFILPEYLTTFLNTEYGIKALKRRARESINQTNINPEEVKEVMIPLLSLETQKTIQTSFKKANDLRVKSQELYKEAEDLLLQELNFEESLITQDSISTKKFSESFSKSGRLDAEYYQPKYDAITHLIKSYRLGYSLIKDLFTQNNTRYNLSRSQHKYIEIGDINIFDTTMKYNFIDKDDLPANAKYLLGYNELLYSTVRPYRGAVSISRYEDKDIVASGAFLILKEKTNFSIETLLVLLRTPAYKEYVMKFNAGSSYPVVRKKELLNLKIPLIDHSIQERIKSKINKSYLMKQQSTKLLNDTKKAVEISIEKSEESAKKWLQKKIKVIEHEV